MPLTAKKRSELRARAHKLSPIVIIGDKGLTDEVLAEVDRSLKAHELIKVRAATADRDAREIFFEKICEALGAQEVQEIGKILVVYRENPEKTGDLNRTGRPRSRTPSPRPESGPRRRRPRTSR
ncbi:MAG TPA: ribosome assembly RNA-binding protein YhbY [Usitatibacter sp.]|nr:ribosome assembly RNA-binding protein YhbY [Usitatibacter sp.]